MDVFDSPLNLAHQQSRKADSLVNSGRFDEAIECHQRAADHLSEAMSATTVEKALESLSLQKDFHVKEQRVIKEKQRNTKMTEKLVSKGGRVSNKTPVPEETDGLTRNGDYMTTTMTASDDTVLLIKTMEECDSLLQFLKSRAVSEGKNADFLDTTYAHIDAKAQLFKSASKIPIDDKLLLEELRVHNEALRFHILDLLKECEEHKKENLHLKDRVKHLEGKDMAVSNESEKSYPLPSNMSLDDLPSIDLPPLEMPKFDFDSLKIQPHTSDQPSGTQQ